MTVMAFQCIREGLSDWEEWLLFCERKSPVVFATEVEVGRQFVRQIRDYIARHGFVVVSTYEVPMNIWNVRRDMVIRTLDLVVSGTPFTTDSLGITRQASEDFSLFGHGGLLG